MLFLVPRQGLFRHFYTSFSTYWRSVKRSNRGLLSYLTSMTAQLAIPDSPVQVTSSKRAEKQFSTVRFEVADRPCCAEALAQTESAGYKTMLPSAAAPALAVAPPAVRWWVRCPTHGRPQPRRKHATLCLTGEDGAPTDSSSSVSPIAHAAVAADGGGGGGTVAAASLPRIDVTGLSPSQVADSVDFSRPCILTGVLPSADCEDWCDALMEDLGEEEVDFQTRDNRDGRSDVFRSSLADFVYCLQDESTHDKSWYLLEEHLLELPQARPELGALLAAPQELLGADEFQLFPSSVRPQNLCAIVGGVGARSFLHSDPMEWMGWNVLLEGRKLWTFLPPSPELDAPLDTYRLAPNAFGSHNISAGWQSNVDLYKRAGETAVGGRASASWPSEGAGGEVMRHAVSGVQEQGELVLIPPRHWHQVYHLEPSVAVASQYMDHRVRHRVFGHILDWCGVAEESRPSPAQFGLLTPADQIREVLKAALVARLGPEQGHKVFDKL